MKQFKVIGIKYETDGCKVKLPRTLVVECDDEVEAFDDEVIDAVSDITGWLVESVEDVIEL